MGPLLRANRGQWSWHSFGDQVYTNRLHRIHTSVFVFPPKGQHPKWIPMIQLEEIGQVWHPFLIKRSGLAPLNSRLMLCNFFFCLRYFSLVSFCVCARMISGQDSEELLDRGWVWVCISGRCRGLVPHVDLRTGTVDRLCSVHPPIRHAKYLQCRFVDLQMLWWSDFEETPGNDASYGSIPALLKLHRLAYKSQCGVNLIVHQSHAISRLLLIGFPCSNGNRKLWKLRKWKLPRDT